MLIDRMPDMVREMERRTDMTFIAKPVWRKRVLNCFLGGVWSVSYSAILLAIGKDKGKEL